MIAVLAIAIVVLASGAIGAVVAFALKTSAAWAIVADARVAKAETDGKLAIATATIATERNRADEEKRKADALDDALADSWSTADPATARERVLARWKINRANLPPSTATGSGPSPVHPASDAPAIPGSDLAGDGLLKPGE